MPAKRKGGNRQMMDRFLAYRETNGLPHKTVVSFRSYLVRWCDWMDDQGLAVADCDLSDLDDFIADRYGQNGWSSRKQAVVVLRAFYRWAWSRKKVEENVAAGLSFPSRGRKATPTFYKPFEAAQLLQSFDTAADVDRLIAMVLLRHGQRISSTVTRRWEHVTLTSGVPSIRYDAFKDSPMLTLPLDEDTAKALKAWYRLRGEPPGDEWLFPNRQRGGHRNKDAFRESLRRACKRAGIAYRGPHELRRTCVTSMLRAGVPLHVVSKQVAGHSHVSTTTTYYAGADEDDVGAAIRALPY